MFKDRKDAGKKLALALKEYKNKDVIVFAIPKGGIPIAYEVAKYLNANFSFIISRKLPYPFNPEAGFGAIAEDGSTFIFPEACNELRQEEIRRIKKEQMEEIKRRIKILREGREIPKISSKIIILVDDGLAMGSTMIASIRFCKKRKPKKIIVAVPTAGRNAIQLVEKEADKVIVLEKPEFFRAVADSYEYWYDVTDKEAINIIKQRLKEEKFIKNRIVK